MSQAGTQAAGYRFDEFYIDASNRQLWREGELLALNSKYFDVLLLLVSQSGQLIEKRRIFDEVWSGVFVTDAALTQCIKDIRKQLGDDASHPRYIKTVPKHGYIFIGNASEAATFAQATSGQATGDEAVDELKRQPSSARALPPSRPYKFLDYFTAEDARLFYGRESEIEAICSKILAHRSFILHGRSGVGKSSILRAGLMPRLKAEGHRVFVIRSFTDPLHQMAGALSRPEDADAPVEGATVTSAAGIREDAEERVLKHLLQQAAKENPNRFVIFFLDQFEEFFSLLAEPVRKRFVEVIGNLIANEALPLRLIFTLREDLLAEMSHLKPAIPEIFHHEYRLERLSREQAALAIAEPASTVGCSFEPQLVERLLDDLSDQQHIDPPQLQIVCDNLYDSRDQNGQVTVAIYERLGTASRILAGYLERVLSRFNAADLQVARETLTSLISIEGQRLVLRAPELVARIRVRAQTGRERVEELIEEMVAARVVRRRRQDGEGWLELAHDFLTPEVQRYLTADEIALKRARGVIERAMENYRAHQLLIDSDVLDFLLPFGDELSLASEEANLLTMSLLNRSRPVPALLVKSSPQVSRLIVDASRSVDSEVRLRAIEAAFLLRDEDMKTLLQKLALWDKHLAVRKAASIALASWFGREAGKILCQSKEAEKATPIRRAISLAMIRDYDKRFVQLPALSIPVAVLVLLGLMWVRLRRGWPEIWWQGIGATIGGGASGLVGGLMLSAGLATAESVTAVQAMTLITVLVSLGVFIGSIGALGVGFGMVAASHITYRHSRLWSVVGGAVGGAIVGGSAKLLGVDTLRALFGKSPTGITGAFEGAIIGAGVSLGAVLTGRLIRGARAWQKIVGASLGAMLAGVLLTVIGGNLFSGSLEIVARSFADSQISLDPLARLFGEGQFGHTMQIILGAIEGLLFGAGMMMGMELFNRRSGESARARGDGQSSAATLDL